MDLPPTVSDDAAPGHNEPSPTDSQYWYALINQSDAADFLHVTPRMMELMRQRGGGPVYIFLSHRCLRYRRIDLREWSEGRVRTSTSDPGPEPQAA